MDEIKNKNLSLEKNPFTKFIDFVKTDKSKKILKIVFLVLILLTLTLTIYNRYYKPEGVSTSKSISDIFTGQVAKDAEKEKTEIAKIDGMDYPVATSNRHPIAIMVENHPDARPQSGLDKASIVYEAIAEGGITRFMAIFGPNAPEKVGPVRSARTYYLDWALEYDAAYAHVGGNIDALDLIPQIGVKDLDQFRYGTQAYWREPQADKATEHTMYTDLTKLYSIVQEKGWDSKTDFTSLTFKSDITKDQRPTSQSITINFSSNSYLVKWDYDRETNMYLRSMSGSTHKDAVSKDQLKAKNIIIQEVAREAVVTRIGENGWKMTTIGTGNAKIYQDGKEIIATWKKDNRTARTKFSDSNNKEIEFNPGTTWYEIVPPGTTVTAQ
ncbi:MAG: hypothetical protein ACD_58C00324G0005 [uncultured bacterium]|nr:MAG: hypothetical protein ACD_58C00324G0005 [uncultured bacterium]